MQGADTPKEKMARVQRYFANPPDWEAEYKRDNWVPRYLIAWLLDDASTLSGVEMMDLVHRWQSVAEAGSILNDPHDLKSESSLRYDRRKTFLARHGRWYLDQAKKLGREATLRDRTLYYNLYHLGPKDEVRPLLETWFKESTDEKELEQLMEMLRYDPGGQARLTTWADDPRLFVARYAIYGLRASYPDEETVKILKRFAERRKREGADPTEQQVNVRRILNVELEIAEKRLHDVRDESEIGRLVAKLSEGSFTANRLVPLLYDPRPVVVREATFWLAQAADPRWDDSYLRATRNLAEQRKKEGATPGELARYANAIRVIEVQLGRVDK